ncbi:MAG TPA: P-loop NTPase [Geomonas sp.]|nr:P-loop NTPase [Geomonas sp.]
MAVEHVVIAGKSGVGRSTTAANLAAVLAEEGFRVALIGYERYSNSTVPLRGSTPLLPVPGWPGSGGAPHYAHGYRGVLCIEAGESAVATGGTEAASLLKQSLLTGYRPDFVLHDLSQEPGPSFRLPVATDGVMRVLAVTTADMTAIQAVNDLFAWLNTVSAVNCSFGGVVANNLSGPLYESIVSDFAAEAGTSVAAKISHSLMVYVSDVYTTTVVQSAPHSHLAYAFRRLAQGLLRPESVARPKHLQTAALKRWSLKWGDIISELETGVVSNGSGI